MSLHGGAQDKNLPLHIAVRIQGADAVVKALLVAHSKGAETRDSVRYVSALMHRLFDPSASHRTRMCV